MRTFGDLEVQATFLFLFEIHFAFRRSLSEFGRFTATQIFLFVYKSKNRL